MAGDLVAAVDRGGHTTRGIGRSDPGVGVRTPHFLLHPFVLQGELPRVDADDAGHPPGGRAPRADVHGCGQEVAGVGLVAAEVGGLEQPDQPGVLQVLGDVVGEAAGPLGLGRVIGEEGAGLLDLLEDVVGHGELLGGVAGGEIQV